MRSIQAGTLLFLPVVVATACGVTPMKRGGKDNPGVLSYAQVKSLRAGQAAKDLVRAFGPPAHQLKADGRVAALAYRAENAAGEEQELRIALDAEMRVTKWTLAPRQKGS